MIITPSSKLATSPIAFPPCLKHFWQCNETSGTTLTDAVNGVILNGMAAPTFGTGYVNPGGTTTPTITGTLTNPLTKTCMLLAVGQFNGGLFRLGPSINGAIQLTQSGATLLADTSGTVCPTTVTAYTNSASDMSRTIVVDAWNSATGMRQIECDTVATYTLKATNETNSAPGITTFSFGPTTSSAWGCPNTVTRLYGVAFFVFTGAVPADVRAAIAWMTKEWALGNKAIYPGWLNVA